MVGPIQDYIVAGAVEGLESVLGELGKIKGPQ